MISVLLLMPFAGVAQGDGHERDRGQQLGLEAMGARTVYKIGFTSGATLTSTAQTTGTITITFPNNTDVTQIFAIDISDGATQVGNFCSHTAAGVNPPVLTCNIFNGSRVNAGDAVSIALDEVTNPGVVANPTVSLFTERRDGPVNSAVSQNYQVVGQNPITNVTAANNQVTQALGARTVYTIGFVNPGDTITTTLDEVVNPTTALAILRSCRDLSEKPPSTLPPPPTTRSSDRTRSQT